MPWKEILGAGSNSRAHRISGIESTRVFEMDLPGVYLSERVLELIEDVAGAEFAERYFEPSCRRLRTNELHRTALARVLRPALG